MSIEKMRDYHCTPGTASLLGQETMKGLGLSYPDVYLHQDTMVTLAKAYQEKEQTPFCILPFCHTVEAEAMGADIQLGNENFGPRAGSVKCQTFQQVLNLPRMNPRQGRMAEVLGACHHLHQEEIPVVLEVSGPFTILGTLMDLTQVFRQMRKEPQLWKQVLEKIQQDLLQYSREAVAQGTNMISYADSAGSVGILGPKVASEMVELFTVPFLTELRKITKGKALIILCPKTTFGLMDLGYAELAETEIPDDLSYQKACVKLGTQLEILGQTCLKQDMKLNGRIMKIKMTGKN